MKIKRIVSVSAALLTACVLVCTFLAIAEPVRCQGPARIIAQEEAKVGQLIRLSVEADADDYMWLVVPASEDFEIYAEGQKAVFSARKPGSYLFIAAYCKNNKVALLRHILEVKGPPKPIIPPGPDSDILELVPYWCHKYSISSEIRSQLNSNFSSIASRAASGEFEEVQELISATAEKNKEIDARPLLDEITKYIVKRAQAGELETVEQYVMLWNRISAALSTSYKVADK